MTLRATYTRTGTGWKGAVKDGKRLVAECEHIHRNRDQTTSRGTAAIFCAEKLLREVEQRG